MQRLFSVVQYGSDNLRGMAERWEVLPTATSTTSSKRRNECTLTPFFDCQERNSWLYWKSLNPVV
jgi:hypothetical protein